jgi:hypothetical protein
MNSSPVRVSATSRPPPRNIALSGRYTFAVCSLDVAVSWISGVGLGIPIGSPGPYTYTHPQSHPWSAHSYVSPPAAQPQNTVGPRPSHAMIAADHGPLPFFWGATTWERRYTKFVDTRGNSGSHTASSRTR